VFPEPAGSWNQVSIGTLFGGGSIWVASSLVLQVFVGLDKVLFVFVSKVLNVPDQSDELT